MAAGRDPIADPKLLIRLVDDDLALQRDEGVRPLSTAAQNLDSIAHTSLPALTAVTLNVNKWNASPTASAVSSNMCQTPTYKSKSNNGLPG
jgi:hypothetical protein